MVSIRQLIHRYDQAIWIRVFGTILSTMAGFMVRPFLALYLYNKLDGNLLLATAIIGLQPVTGLIAGLISGGLADRYGRKPVMVLGLLIEGLSISGYILANSVWAFAALTICSGIGNTLFQPAAQAQVADVVPEERRSEVFGLLHSALNIGAACGPLLGVFLYKINPSIGFSICSSTLVLFSLVVLWKIKESLPDDVRRRAIEAKLQPKSTRSRLRFREHKILFGLLLSSVPFALMYTQVDTILPQHLKTHFNDYLNTFATIMTINGTLVVCLQLLVVKFADRFPIPRLILIAYLLVAITAFGYGWSTWFLPLILSEVCFTLGEMLNGPQIQKAIALMAPEDLRGRYFAVFGASWAIAGMFGPIVGALSFTHIGGRYWFTIVSLLLVVGGIASYKLLTRGLHQPPATGQTTDAPDISSTVTAV